CPGRPPTRCPLDGSFSGGPRPEPDVPVSEVMSWTRQRGQVSASDLVDECGQVRYQPPGLLLHGELLRGTAAESPDRLLSSHVQRAGEVGAQVVAHGVALLARLAGPRGDHQGDSAGMTG